MSEEKQFPIIVPEGWPTLWKTCPESIPWSVVEPFNNQAYRNHGQSLKRLAARGGLSPAELVAVMHNIDLWEAWPRLRNGFWKEYQKKNKAPHPDHYRAALFVVALAQGIADPHKMCDKHYCEVQRQRIAGQHSTNSDGEAASLNNVE